MARWIDLYGFNAQSANKKYYNNRISGQVFFVEQNSCFSSNVFLVEQFRRKTHSTKNTIFSTKNTIRSTKNTTTSKNWRLKPILRDEFFKWTWEYKSHFLIIFSATVILSRYSPKFNNQNLLNSVSTISTSISFDWIFCMVFMLSKYDFFYLIEE